MVPFFNVVQLYTAYYPIIMTIVWIMGSWVSGLMTHRAMIKSDSQAKVTILLAMFNEEYTIGTALNSLSYLTYENFDVVVVDDKSEDKSVTIVMRWMTAHPTIKTRLIQLPENVGKAAALNEAIKVIHADFVLATDADATLAPGSIQQLLASVTNDRIGAVTGKPIVRNRTTLLGRLQALEYVVIIDRIKRAQDSFYGGIMTVAGVISLYRTDALRDVGGFDSAAITEDIDITWRLKKNNWQVHYNPKALVYILVPETLKGFFKQRTRWSVGGLEVLLRNISWSWKQGFSAQTLLLLDMCFSHIWAWFYVMTMTSFIITSFATRTFSLPGVIIFLYVLLFIIMFIQGIRQDEKQSHLSKRDLFELPFYSIFYWSTALMTAIMSQFVVIFSKDSNGKWTSPDRGR